jgi:hypothetical protein
MAEERPVVMENKQLKVFIKPTGKNVNQKESVVETAPKVSDPKESVAQRLSEYAFGEKIEQPGKYIFDSYLAPTGKRVANDIVEYFLQLIKHTFQRWIWHGKTLDDGKWGGDRTSFSRYSQNPEPIKAMVKLSPVKELTFATRAEAGRVLDELRGTAANENGGWATVRQYYEISGCPQLCENGVSSSSGWNESMLKKVEITEQPDGDGFCLKLPRPVSLTG